MKIETKYEKLAFVSYLAIIIILIFFNLNGCIDDCIDLTFVFTIICCLFVFIISDNYVILDLFHMMVAYVCLGGIAIFSKNPYLLSLNNFVLIYLHLIREKFGYCLINNQQNNSGIFVETSNKLIKKNAIFNFLMNWDYVGIFLLIINTVRLILLGAYRHPYK